MATRLSNALFLAALTPVLLTQGALAQLPGRPGRGEPGIESLPRLHFEALDPERLQVEDAAREAAGLPPRFAIAREVSVTPGRDGAWEHVGDGLLTWRYRITAAGALSLNLGFGRYRMPPGGRLVVRAADGSASLGPYTIADNDAHGELWTPVIPTDDVVVELTVPEEQRGAVELVLTRVNQGYRVFGAGAGDKGGVEKISRRCNIDVVCPAGDPYRDIIRSVVWIGIRGVSVCTGALINNTAQDLKPFLLSAYHCGLSPANAASVVTYWNYQNSTCRTPNSRGSGMRGDGSFSQALSGAIFRAADATSDFALMELDDPLPASFHAFWAGWNAEPAPPSSAVCIHHAGGEEKRISIDEGPLAAAVGYFGTTDAFLRARWELGVTDPGSSGAPLFNEAKQIVGQLQGGGAECGGGDQYSNDYFGRVFRSWEGGGSPSTRLRDWLDPLGIGLTSLGGTDRAVGPPPPAAPSALEATASTATEVLLAWRDNSFNETEFQVEVSEAGDPFTEAETVAADVTTTTVTGLRPATTYSFRVRSRYRYGASAYSNVATATTPAVAPRAPEALSAATASATEVIVSWVDTSDNEEEFIIEGRTVARLGSAATEVAAGEAAPRATFVDADFVQIASVPAGVTQYVIRGLEPSTVYNFRVRARNASGSSGATPEAAATTRAESGPTPCAEDGGSLCLLEERFEARVLWRNPRNGRRGEGHVAGGSGGSGYYWFFAPTSLELAVKMVDGVRANGYFWVFTGALTDVEYWVLVTDTLSGDRTTTYNEPGNLCGLADTEALAPLPEPAATGAGGAGGANSFAGGSPAWLRAARPPFPAGAPAASARGAGGCVPDETTLCLLDGRFAVTVDWANPRNGATGVGRAVASSTGAETGFFWFFSRSSLELIVKMIDGRNLNGEFWFFYGALTDVEYEITVRDTETGDEAVYHHEPYDLCGEGDTDGLGG